MLEYQSRKQMLRVVLLVFLLLVSAEAIRLPGEKPINIIELDSGYSEASDYRNGEQCVPRLMNGYDSLSLCDPSLVHVAMTLDSGYLRGSVAAINSILRHASCPENIFFHFLASSSSGSSPVELTRIVRSAFPSLNFKAYPFDEGQVKALISSSVRKALDNPLNYARSYLAEIIEQCVDRVVYLDSDVIVVDDIQKLWSVSLTGSRIIAAPEYCHVDIGKYFTGEFWSDSGLSGDFQGRKACYFNTGVMVIDLGKWRKGDYTKKIEKWMEIQRERRIYHLGSLPPFLLVFGGEVEAIDHRWNQHGLGGDNVVNSCRKLHPGPISLLHWSGKGKPWVRLDEGRPCPVDHLWKPYDLYTSPNFSRQ